ncbi:DMT family transporter [Schleiferilactobacillus harbinensis]|uniref:QacE family quaternary ammonium compound efflux SMR transporter n=2 Tax=Schleiferilactobacillus harbinensis TaxID=304207 RepID=A0A5P8M8Y7_9LACO|nr:multidrug efflux SMR transporter [Schleiferilactobacillus harbinensis]QFR24998.1 QacE family quaternary ammonium compound efflux SMR transporter [Schleiferilactobacillus harbinensis]
MAWLYLVFAGIFEVVWATFMKLSNGFTHLGWSIATLIGMIASFGLLSQATTKLPMSLAYPIWTGIGAVGTVIAGVVLFGDQLKPATWFFVALLFVGIIGIKLTTGGGE